MLKSKAVIHQRILLYQTRIIHTTGSVFILENNREGREHITVRQNKRYPISGHFRGAACLTRAFRLHLEIELLYVYVLFHRNVIIYARSNTLLFLW